MPRKKADNNSGSKKITEKDLFGSIPKPISVDPFEGIDLKELSISSRHSGEMKEPEPAKQKNDFDDILAINPLDDIDLQALSHESESDDFDSINNFDSPKKTLKADTQENLFKINPIDDIDLGSLLPGNQDPEQINKSQDPVRQGKIFDEIADIDFIVKNNQRDASVTENIIPRGVIAKPQTDMPKPDQEPVKKGPPQAENIYINYKEGATLKELTRTTLKNIKIYRNKRKARHKPVQPGFVSNGSNLKQLLQRAYEYVEIHRLREKISNDLEKENRKTVLLTSPHDNAGNTLLVSLLGYNAAYFSHTRALLMDLNMRRPQLHIPFGLRLERGFSEVANGALDWADVLQDTGLPELKLISAGTPTENLALILNQAILENLINDMKKHFDLIIIDSSPVLIQNKNNVDPVLLSIVCDMSIMLIQDNMTKKKDLTKAVEAFSRDGGSLNGIIYNQQFKWGALPKLLFPLKHM